VFNVARYSNTNPFKPSTINNKRTGNKGHPYLRPLHEMKKGDATPFIKIEK
jgi:hypothetical protein